MPTNQTTHMPSPHPITTIKYLALALLFCGLPPAVQTAGWLTLDYLLKFWQISLPLGIQLGVLIVFVGVMIGIVVWLMRGQLPVFDTPVITRASLCRAVMVFVAWIVIEIQLTRYLKLPANDFLSPFLVDTPIWLIWVAVCVIAPIYEELIFRGVLWQLGERIFADIRHRAVICSLFISSVFVLQHTQYTHIEQLILFGSSLTLCYARHQTKSLGVPIILHIANNTLALMMLR